MWTSWTMQNKSIWFYGTPCRKLLKQFLILYKYKSSLQNQSFVRGERENPVTSLCKSPFANAVQVKYQVWQIYQYFIIIMIWDHQDVVLFMCNLFLVFHLFILTCCVWYFALCFLVLTSPKPGLLCLVWVLVVYSVKMTFRVSCFCFVCRNFSCSKWLCHISHTPSLPAGVDSACTGEASGMLHRDILPAESPWISNLWKGSRRPKKNRVTGGQIRSWWMVGGGKKHVNIWKHEFEPNIHQTTHILLNNKLVFFFCPKAVWAEMFGFVLRLLSFKQQQHTANYMKTEPHISNSLGHLTCGHVKKSLDSKYWMTLTCCLGFTGAFIRVKGLIETYEVQQQNKKQM